MNRYLSEFDDCLRCEELTLHCKEHSRCLQCQGCSECSPVLDVASPQSLNRVSEITGDPGVSHRADAPGSFDFAGERAEATRDPHEHANMGTPTKSIGQTTMGARQSDSRDAHSSTEAEVCDSRIGSADATATTSPAEHIASRSSGSLAGEGAAPPLGSAPVLTTADHLSQAIAQDEGEKGWNQQQINDIARKMNRMAAGGFNSLEILVSGVEEVLA